MRTELLIADFTLSFTATFQNTARKKWGVDFENSNITSTLANLEQLVQIMRSAEPEEVNKPNEITLKDVERVSALLVELLNRWRILTRIPPPAKLYTFLHQLHQMSTPTTAEIAKDVVKEITTPKPSPKASQKERKQAEIDAMKVKMALDFIRKQNRKR